MYEKKRFNTYDNMDFDFNDRWKANKENNNNDNKVEIDKTESSTTDKPQTGDNFMGYEISLLASLVGILYINRKTKKED